FLPLLSFLHSSFFSSFLLPLFFPSSSLLSIFLAIPLTLLSLTLHLSASLHFLSFFQYFHSSFLLPLFFLFLFRSSTILYFFLSSFHLSRYPSHSTFSHTPSLCFTPFSLLLSIFSLFFPFFFHSSFFL